MASKKSPTAKATPEKSLRAFALTFPGAFEKESWEFHSDVGVGKKTFVFLSVWQGVFNITCKLPESGSAAALLKFAEPAGYGLGKNGWVSARFPEGKSVPEGLLHEWIRESYRAIAPKKLLAELDPERPAGVSAPRAPKRPPPRAPNPAPSKTPPSGRART